MTVEGWVALGILVAAAVLLLRKWLPMEVTALSIPVALYVTGVLDTPAQALMGFSSDAVIAVAGIFVVGAGLQESGVTTLLARALQRIGGVAEWRLVLTVMATAITLSAFMQNAAAVAILLPAVALLARRTEVPPSKLLLPLSFGAVLGGNLTLIGATNNLLVNESATRPLHMFAFSIVGLPLAVIGTGWMVLHGRRILPVRTSADRLREALLPEAAARNYGLAKTLFRMRLVPQSKVVGRTIAEAGVRAQYGLQVLAVVRDRRIGTQYIEPRPDLVLAEGDELLVEGEDESAWRFAESEVVQFGLAGAGDIERILGRGMTLAEVSVPPRSGALGRTVRDVGFRHRFGLNVLALWRRGEALREGAADLPLEVGDAFLVSGKASRVRELARHPDYVVLTEHAVAEDVSRAPVAIALLSVAIVPPALSLLPPSLSALAAAVLMVATGCLSPTQAVRAVDFRVIFLVIGMIPLGAALREHGVAALASAGVVGAASPLGEPALIAALFALAAALAMLTTNATSAALVAPVAASAAAAGAIGEAKALLAVCYGSSCAFVLPFHQTNVQVMSPGGYTPRDVLRLGSIMTVIVAVVSVVVLSLVRP